MIEEIPDRLETKALELLRPSRTDTFNELSWRFE
jgi:hypothetical protein